MRQFAGGKRALPIRPWVHRQDCQGRALIKRLRGIVTTGLVWSRPTRNAILFVGKSVHLAPSVLIQCSPSSPLLTIWLPGCKPVCLHEDGLQMLFLWQLTPHCILKNGVVFFVCLISLFNGSLRCRAEIYFWGADRIRLPDYQERTGPWTMVMFPRQLPSLGEPQRRTFPGRWKLKPAIPVFFPSVHTVVSNQVTFYQVT